MIYNALKRCAILTIIILLIGTDIVPNISSIVSKVDVNLQPNASQSSNIKMAIPKYYFDLSKAPSIYTNRDDKKIKYFEEFNFPIGTFGNNYISYGPHGIDRIALYNNLFDSLGGSYGTGAYNPQCLNGTFLGVYCDNGDKKVTKILQKYSPADRNAKDFGLEPIQEMECYSNIPIGYYQFADSELSAEIGLTVYSPIILYDVKNSSMPTSIWIFQAYNPSEKPIDISFLFSLENDIGWRCKEELNKKDGLKKFVDYEYTWQRTGTYNLIQENEDMIGIKYTYDENIMSKSHPEYLGNMTLATTKQPNVTISYVSQWDTLGDGKDLLSNFFVSGQLNNQNNSNYAVEGKHIYAGALSAKVSLKPGEKKDVPFVLATCFPCFNLSDKVTEGIAPQGLYEWYWTNYYNDSWNIASYSLNNYEKWLNAVELWQERLYSSGPPPEMITYMIGSLTTFVSDVFFSKDGYWFTSVWDLGSDVTTYVDWFLCMFYPEIAKYCALQRCDIVDRNGGRYEPNHILHAELDFIIRSYRAWIWNQNDEEFLQRIYSSCMKATEYTINKDVNLINDCLIHNIGNDLRNDMWAMPLSSSLNSMWLLCLKCMTSMAEHLHYSDDANYFSELFEKAQDSFIEKFWFKGLQYEYFKLCAKKLGLWAWGDSTPIPILVRDSNACMIEQILGVWHGKAMNQDILPITKIKTALNSIYNINRDYNNNLGWITAIMGGGPPYFIDRFGTYLYNVPNKISPYCQWSFATSLLTYGLVQDGLTVANTGVENNLYKNGGIYFGDDDYVLLSGTNKINKEEQCLKDKIKWEFGWSLERLFGGGADHLGPPYPPRGMFNLPSWSFYQSAAGFTPCIGGLKIKPRIGGENLFYMCKFADCKIEMNVTGSGDFIKFVEINGEPYSTYIDEQIFIPLELFIEQEKINIHIILEDPDEPEDIVPSCVQVGDILMMDIKMNSIKDIIWKVPGYYNEHIAIYAGNNTFINAHGTGVSEESYSYFLRSFRNGCENHAFLRVKTATEEQRLQAVKFAEDKIGAHYQNIFTPPYFGLKIADPNSNHPTANMWYCMELIWAAYYNQGIDIDSNGWKSPKMVTGNEILNDDDIEVYLTIM
jgi:uncharacterized protein (DUF608 family)/uncharacterized protein YycO